MPRTVRIRTETISLGAFFKWVGVAPTGGAAKQLIESGVVEVNGTVDRRRGRQLHHGDRVGVGGETFVVRYEPDGT